MYYPRRSTLDSSTLYTLDTLVVDMEYGVDSVLPKTLYTLLSTLYTLYIVVKRIEYAVWSREYVDSLPSTLYPIYSLYYSKA